MGASWLGVSVDVVTPARLSGTVLAAVKLVTRPNVTASANTTVINPTIVRRRRAGRGSVAEALIRGTRSTDGVGAGVASRPCGSRKTYRRPLSSTA